MMIFVDADATPRDVLIITRRMAKEAGIALITVSSINHNIDGPNHIQVDATPQATDMEIVKRIRSDEQTIVITQDYGLAAMVLARNGRAISPSGRIFSDENIDSLLAERAMSAKLRRSGKVRLRGPRARTAADNAHFEEALQGLINSFGENA